MLDIGISTGLFYHKNIIYYLEKIKNAGFENVELWAGASGWGKETHFDYNDEEVLLNVKNQLRLLKINVSSINAPFSEMLDISSLGEMQRGIAVSEVKKAVIMCEFFKAPFLVVHPSVKSAQLTDVNVVKKKMEQIKKSIGEIAENAMMHKVKIALENPAPHLLGGWSSDLLEMLGDFPKESVGVCFDVGHANLIRDPSAYLKDVSGRLLTLHISDNDGTYSAHLIPGEGKIKWNELGKALADAQFEGVFMLEVLGGARYNDPDDVLARSYKNAVKILKGVRL